MPGHGEGIPVLQLFSIPQRLIGLWIETMTKFSFKASSFATILWPDSVEDQLVMHDHLREFGQTRARRALALNRMMSTLYQIHLYFHDHKALPDGVSTESVIRLQESLASEGIFAATTRADPGPSTDLHMAAAKQTTDNVSSRRDKRRAEAMRQTDVPPSKRKRRSSRASSVDFPMMREPETVRDVRSSESTTPPFSPRPVFEQVRDTTPSPRRTPTSQSSTVTNQVPLPMEEVLDPGLIRISEEGKTEIEADRRLNSQLLGPDGEAINFIATAPVSEGSEDVFVTPAKSQITTPIPVQEQQTDRKSVV